MRLDTLSGLRLTVGAGGVGAGGASVPEPVLYLLLVKDTSVEMAEPSDIDGTRQALVSGYTKIKQIAFSGGKIYFGRSDSGIAKVYSIDPNPEAPNETLVRNSGIAVGTQTNVNVDVRDGVVLYRPNTNLRRVTTGGASDTLLENNAGSWPSFRLAADGLHYFRQGAPILKRLLADGSAVASFTGTDCSRLVVRSDGVLVFVQSNTLKYCNPDGTGIVTVKTSISFPFLEEAFAYDEESDNIYYRTSTGLRKINRNGTGDEAVAGTMTGIIRMLAIRV